MAEIIKGAHTESMVQAESLARTASGGATNQRQLMARIMRHAKQHDWWLQLGLLAFMLFWYGILLHVAQPPAWRTPKLDLTFNSMLEHLLNGQFDVDPQIVGNEGFLRDGHVYAYWGIWCALLRLPLWILGRMNADITMWSCLAAVCLAAMAKVRTVILIKRYGARDRASEQATGLVLAYVLLGGSEIGFLKASVFQEVVSWATAFGAVFVYFAIKGLVQRNFSTGTLCCMALCAGLAILTRVTTGLGLTLAFGLLLLGLAAQSCKGAGPEQQSAVRRAMQMLTERRVLFALAVLAFCVAAAGAVNYFRWGNPLTFANFKLYLYNKVYADRLPRLARYGVFNIRRVPFALLYYLFSPIWGMQMWKGQHLPLEPTLTRLFENIELPPSSLLLTDLLPLCLIVFLLIALWKRRLGNATQVSQWAAIAVGLLAPCLLILEHICLTYRGRMEFYPEIDFLAFWGLYIVVTDEAMRARFAKHRMWVEAALLISIVASHAAWTLYWKVPLGLVP